MKRRRGAAVQDAGVIGWISISEVFLLCGVTLLTVALAVESNLDKTRDELADLKNAESEVPGLKAKIVDLDRARERDQRTIDDQKGRLAESDRKALKLAADLARLGGQLEAANARGDSLREAVARLTTERDELASALARSRAEGKWLWAEWSSMLDEARRLEDRLTRIDESIVMPLNSAKLVIKVRSDALPEGYDLDLYVEDPHDQVCFWAQPRTMWKENETGLLFLSEDLRNLRNTSEEIFYSPNVEPSDLNHPYQVFCMLMSKSKKARPVALDVPVRWEVAIDWKGKLEPIKDGLVRVESEGDVVYDENAQAYGYRGLVPLAAFRWSKRPGEKPAFLAPLPMPRLWSTSNRGGGKSANKARYQQPAN